MLLVIIFITKHNEKAIIRKIISQKKKNTKEKPLFLISERYPGVWLEHVYDSVFYAMLDPTKLYLAENTLNLFIDNQRTDSFFLRTVSEAPRRTCRRRMI